MSSELDERAGPFYDAAGLTVWLHVSYEELQRLTSQRKLVAIRTSDDHSVFPTFQFSDAGEALLGLPAVQEILDPDAEDPIGNALWLNTSSELFDGLSPAEMLRAGRVDEVVVAAGRVARGWEG